MARHPDLVKLDAHHDHGCVFDLSLFVCVAVGDRCRGEWLAATHGLFPLSPSAALSKHLDGLSAAWADWHHSQLIYYDGRSAWLQSGEFCQFGGGHCRVFHPADQPGNPGAVLGPGPQRTEQAVDFDSGFVLCRHLSPSLRTQMGSRDPVCCVGREAVVAGHRSLYRWRLVVFGRHLWYRPLADR